MRGIEGMLHAVAFARENYLPYFGICLGMQVMVIEYARNVAGIRDANSGEFDEQCKNKVIDFLPGQGRDTEKGGTLRLGAYPCTIKKGSRLESFYREAGGDDSPLCISERHRHRYEFNNDFRDILSDKGLNFSGISPDGQLIEAAELSDRAFFIGVQFHPEFKSRPNRAHPLFRAFIKASLKDKV